MPMRAFFDNIGTILLFAVFGTLFNTICIGLSIYAFTTSGIGWICKFVFKNSLESGKKNLAGLFFCLFFFFVMSFCNWLLLRKSCSV